MLDLTPIKAALEEWRRVKEAIDEEQQGEWEVQGQEIVTYDHDAQEWEFIARVAAEEKTGDFIAHAHNTPIEDYLAQLIAEVERLQGSASQPDDPAALDQYLAFLDEIDVFFGGSK